MKLIERRTKQIFMTLVSAVMLLVVMPVTVFAQESHDHPICGKTCTHGTNGCALDDHIVSTPWIAWDGSDQDEGKEGIQLTSGNWYLSNDIAPSDIVEIIGEVNLCLNGKVFSSDPSHRDHRILIPEVGAGEAQNVLNLCDCQETEHRFTPDSNGLWKLDEGNGTKSVKGGVIIGANCWGGAIENAGLLNMYGGNVVGNKVISYGAITAMEPVNIYGGTVCGNTGEAAFFSWHWGARSNLYGGKIYENTVADAGVKVMGSSSIGLAGAVEIYDNGIDAQDKNLSCDWSSKAVILDALTNNTPIGICGDDHVIIRADGTNVTDLTDYMNRFVSDEAGKFLALTADKKGIELTSYVVTDQPNINNNYTVTVNVPDGAKYQWHKAVVTETPYSIQEAIDSHYFDLLFDTYDEANDVCIARDYGASNGINFGYNLLYLDIDRVRTEGILRVTSISQSEGITIKLLDYEGGQEITPIDELAWNLEGNHHYRLVALTDYDSETGKSALDPLPTLTATFSTCVTTVNEALTGQEAAAFDTQNLATGKYICKITWDKGNADASDDAVVLSEVINFKTIDISGNVDISGECVYGQTLTANYSGIEKVTYQWYRDNSIIDGATGKEYILTGSDISKIIKVVVTGAGNYEGTKSAQTATVQKAPLTITANNNTITYGDAPANRGVTYTGFVNGETDSILDGTLAYGYSYSQYSNVGAYDITPSGLTADNYEITFQKGILTVEQKEIGINWNNTSFIFDGTVQKPTAAATGVVNSDQIELIISGAQTNASDTAYTATVAGIDGAKAINYKLSSNVTTEFTIGKANQSAPTGFTKTDETIFKKADGIITGITANMEYRKDGESAYTGVNSSALENISAGKYYVRYAADSNHNASPDTEITIEAGRKLKITLPQNTVGYTVTATANEIGYGDNADIALTIADGYSKTESFKFYVNGVECSAHLVDGIKYELDGIVSDVNIMVEGIADVTAPTAQIEVVENKWTSFLSNIIFDLFFDKTQDITITANDAGSGVNTIEYKLSNNALTETEVREIIAWEGYNGTFKINPDNKYIVYAKITDNAGNVTYISSDGLILDATVAVISGIENNGIYYGDTIVTFTDALAGIDKVAVDSSEVILDDGKYTITADNAEHTITVTDKAGNVVEYKVTVYKNQPGKYTDVTPDTNVGNGKFTETIDKLKEKIPFTQEEKNQIEYGADVEVWLEVKDISNTVSAEDKAKILEKLGNADVAMYLDIVMFKQIGGNTASRLTQLSNNVEITFRLADSDINKDENVTRTYQIIHVHDGEVEVINPVFNAENKTLTFLTDRFSTYAVVYTDVSIESSTDETSSSTEQTTETVETSEVPASNQPPKTGDNSLAGLWIVLMCISGITVSVAVATASKRSLGR